METMLDFLHKLVYLSTLTLVIGKLNVPETTVTDVVSFDFTIGGEDVGTIDIGLFGETVPLTVENFIQFSSRGPGLGYEGSKIHRVIENFMIQGGDFVKGDGSGEASIYGGRFADENFKLHHYGAGWVSMANAGADTNTCQFFITAKNTYWLDDKHVVFGKVLRGMWVLKQIMKVDTDDKDEPQVDIVISKTSHEKLNETFTVAKEGADWDT